MLARRRTNWAGNVTFGAARLHRPSSLGELRALVASSERAHALGAGHSFSPVADTVGDLIAVDGLPKVMDIDAGRAVTVSAGVSYAELAGYLHRAGYALGNLASLPHLSIAGACATGTHGSGDGNAGLAAAVAAVELVTADGQIVTMSRNTDLFGGVPVGLGALGIVTGLTLDIGPTFEIRQFVYEDLPADQLGEHLGEIFAGGYSVSVFTDWRRSRAVWLKQLADRPPPDRRWLGARLADGPRHPVPGMSAAYCTSQLGQPGPWSERLPHFRPDSVPSTGAELQSEYLISRQHAAPAVAAIGRIGHLVAPALQICELRTVAPDDLWLSPSYQRHSLAIHFTWIDDARAATAALAAVEAALAPFSPRPHWGKLFRISPQLVAGRYQRMADFRELRGRLDPGGKFLNDFIGAFVAAKNS